MAVLAEPSLRRGFIVPEVAAAAGVHPNQVGRLERGAADVFTSTTLRIVHGLGVPLTEVAREYEARLSGEREH